MIIYLDYSLKMFNYIIQFLLNTKKTFGMLRSYPSEGLLATFPLTIKQVEPPPK